MPPIHSSLIDTILTALALLEEHNRSVIALTMTKEELEHALRVLEAYMPSRSQ